MEENLDPNIKANNEILNNTNKSNSEEIKKPSENILHKNNDDGNSQNNSAPKTDIKNESDKPVKSIPIAKKEPPIEKKPFQEFINNHLIPDLIEEINQRGLKINNINLKKSPT